MKSASIFLGMVSVIAFTFTLNSDQSFAGTQIGGPVSPPAQLVGPGPRPSPPVELPGHGNIPIPKPSPRKCDNFVIGQIPPGEGLAQCLNNKKEYCACLCADTKRDPAGCVASCFNSGHVIDCAQKHTTPSCANGLNGKVKECTFPSF